MKIYTLFYKDTGLYNRNIFVMPNDAAAKKAMQLNLMDKTSPQSERFRDEAKLGNTILKALCKFSEEYGVEEIYELPKETDICNLKELLNDNNGNLETAQPDNT